MWSALQRRDSKFDGRFYFGVVTTGVYCRPSCPARRPRRENTRFLASTWEAEREGFRACLRCRPTETVTDHRVAVVRQMCDHIQIHCEGGKPLSLGALARRSGYSVTHLNRMFRELLGVTPRQFVEACRMDLLKRHLRATDSVTGAIYAAGYASSSRVYEKADRRLGMTPRTYGVGGEGTVIGFVDFETDFGRLMVGATDRGICFVQFGDSAASLLVALKREYPNARLEPGGEGVPQLARWAESVAGTLRGSRPHADLPLDLRTTAFRYRVYRYLTSIPRGEVRSYADVAAAIGRPKATRAVATACASNTIAVLIPCHRVIRASGDLAGYRWGTERKRKLLAAEKAFGALARSAD
jgi:AraC family transcriptional regulator of adaptative response/methylated-DNA-[protein]-cysteine methyltransferase